MAPLTLRPAAPADGPGVRALFAATHGRELPDALWRWRYHGRPDAPSVCTVADDGGVVAHVGALVSPADVPDGGLRLALWTDLMTHPARRDLGLFMDLAQANLDACRAAGVGLVYAFPNDRSYPLLKRLFGFKDLGDLPAYEGPLGGLRRPSGPPAAEARPSAAELDGFWRRVGPKDALTLRRDAAWVDWRLHRRPGPPYGVFYARTDGLLTGWAAAKVFEGPGARVGDVLELWAEVPEARNALVCALWDWFAARKADVVSAWAAPGDHRGSYYESLGLAPTGPKTHFVARELAPAGKAFPGEPAYWRIGKGDSDVF